MNGKEIAERTLALAGVVQAAQLADRLACTGEAPEESIASSVGSLFAFNPASTEAVFGGAQGVKFGLRTLCDITEGGMGRYGPAIRYARDMISLEKSMRRDLSMGSILHHRLESLQRNRSISAEDIDDVCTELNNIYQDTLSTMTPRIRLNGIRRHLSDNSVAHRLRGLMMAGVRAAMLWRQVGGSYLRLLTERRQMQRAARGWLEQADAAPDSS